MPIKYYIRLNSLEGNRYPNERSQVLIDYLDILDHNHFSAVGLALAASLHTNHIVFPYLLAAIIIK